MAQTNKNTGTELLDWFLVNLLVPLLIPFFFACCVRFLIKIDMSVFQLFSKLLKDGVYTFLGLTILISLFQDYRVAKNAFTLKFYLFFFVVFSITGFIFISSLGFIPENVAVTYEENSLFLVSTTGCIFLSSLLFKYTILKIKYAP